MGIGLVTSLKIFAPWTLYILGLLLGIKALTGRTEPALIFLTVIAPLRNVIEKFHPLPMGNDYIDILLFMCLIGWFFRSIKTDDKFFDRSPLTGIIFTFILYLFISLLQGSMYLNKLFLIELSDPRVQLAKNFITMLIFYFMIFNNFREKKWMIRLFLAMCFTMVFMNMYLVRQIAWYSSIVSRTKISGTFVFLGPNEIAAFYNQYSVVLLGVYFFIKNKRHKIMLLGLLLVNCFCITFLFSRAAYLGLAVGFFFLFMMKKKVLLVPLIMIAIFWQIFLPQKVQDRINQTKNEYGELDESSASRITMWEHSLHLFGQNPISGVGYGVFRYLGFGLGDTHNVYLKILAEQGLIGISIFLLLLFVMFLQGIKLFMGGDDDFSKGLGLGFATCIVVLAVNNMFGDRWTYTSLSTYLWVYAALVTRLNVMAYQVRRHGVSSRAKVKKKIKRV